MTKKNFIRQIIISSVLTAIAIALIITFCVCLFIQYTQPNGDNTSISGGSVADVYHGGKKKGVIVEMSNGDQLQLVYPNFSGELYSAIGYDLDELCELLEGEEIEDRRMDRLPWVTEIHVNDIVINNNELTNKQIVATRICIVIIGLIMLAFPICGQAFVCKDKGSRRKYCGSPECNKRRVAQNTRNCRKRQKIAQIKTGTGKQK